MTRLRAVLSPAPAAGRGPRLTAFGLAGLIAALTGAGSLAVAGEREAVIRIRISPAPSLAPTPLPPEQPPTVDLGAGSRTLLNGEPMPEGLPIWAVAPERIDVRTPPAGSGEMNFILPFTGTTPVSVDGRRMPAGFPASGVNPDAVARVDVVGDHVRYTLKPEAEVRRARKGADAAEETGPSHLSPEQQARYQNPTGRQYQALCASSDVGDRGFCMGVLSRASMTEAEAASPAFCAPDPQDHAAMGGFVDRAKAGVAQVPVSAGQSAYDVARAGLVRAYPCETAQEGSLRPAADRPEPGTASDFVPLTVTADIEGRPLAVQGDETLRVVLTDENGAVMNTFGTLNPGRRASGPLGPLGMAIAADDFPGPGESTRTYTLTGEIRGPGRALRYVAEPVTIRLAPGARHVDLRPTLSFRPA